MCKNHKHLSRISDIHSFKEREFDFNCEKDAKYSVSDDFATKEAKENLALNPNDRDSLLALGNALAYQMRYNEALEYYEKARDLYPDCYLAHRKCAIRYISTLDFARAQTELDWCADKTDDPLDITYLKAVTAYCLMEYGRAKDLFLQCYPLAKGNGEMYVAALYWHFLCLVSLGEDISEAKKYCFDSIKCGHHIGYMQTVNLFLSEREIDNIPNDDELDRCIYLYGLSKYYKFKGEESKWLAALDATLNEDTYFSCFAYLGAYCEKSKMREAAEQKLDEFFRQNDKVALAFSGGTDSAYLLKKASVSGVDIKAYFVRSQFQPSFEVGDAKRLTEELNIKCEFIDVDVLGDCNITSNTKDRCYFCKRKIFGAIIKKAKDDGYDLTIDGTNATDDFEDRPGMRALREYGVISPLRDCGLSKGDVRSLSKKLGIFTWDKPSYSCLATRVAVNQIIRADTLLKIEEAENILMDLGYTNFRVRVKDNAAHIEVSKRQNQKFENEKTKIIDMLSDIFDSVAKSEVLR